MLRNRATTAPALVALLLVAGATLVGCGGDPSPVGARLSAQTTAAPTDHPRVLAISIDGLNPRAITRLGPEGAPAFTRLFAEGAGTMNARTEHENTHTLPNHTGMLTGRRVDPAHGGHGVDWDNDRRTATVQGALGHPVESVFTVVHQAGDSTALFATKTKFGLFERSWPGDIDRYVADQPHPLALLRQAREDLVTARRDLTFLHISFPDLAGHKFGFMSAKYVAAVAETDRELGKILALVDATSELRENLVVVLTADHGGIGPDHSDPTVLQNYRVPFVVWGAGIHHADLYAINPDYRDPGRARTGYAGAQPIRNGDLADLVTSLLGLPAVPGSELDRAEDLTTGS